MKLVELRHRKNLTQSEASEILGIPLRTYKRYENNSELEGSFKHKQIYEKLSKIPTKAEEKIEKPLNIAVVGIGYVGLSLAALLSVKNNVVAMDINEDRVNMVNNRTPYFKDAILEKMFKYQSLKLKVMCVNEKEFLNKDFIIIATNTNFDKDTNDFDMSSVLDVIHKVRLVNKNVLIVIKSTVPMGFTSSLNDKNIIFSPEFLREGSAVCDNLHPSRIIIGVDHLSNKVRKFANCLSDISLDNKEVIYMSSHEAEGVKLFSNAYLAMRVAYFNELDTYALNNNLKTSNIIHGVSLDPRIGDYYNNPSFGYGGYCLPKDTAQLKSSFLDLKNNNIIQAIVESNQTRKEYIALKIIEFAFEQSNKKKQDVVIGFYRLSMKKDSDNFRDSATLDVANILINKGYKVVIFEPNYHEGETVDSLESLLSVSDIVVSNRMEKCLEPYKEKVFTRDLTNKD